MEPESIVLPLDDPPFLKFGVWSLEFGVQNSNSGFIISSKGALINGEGVLVAIQTLLTSVVGVARRFGGARSFCRTEHGRGLRCQECVGGVSLF